MGSTRATAVFALALLGGLAHVPPASAQQPPATNGTAPETPIDDEIDAAESDNPKFKRKLIRWNEYESPFLTLRVGGGYLYDYASFVQDDVSKEQVEVDDQWKLRDTRVLFSGKLKFKRATTWSAGIMYDKANDEWVWRQTGIMVAVPEIWGHIFVWPKQGRVLTQQSDGWLRRLGHGARADQRRDDSDPC